MNAVVILPSLNPDEKMVRTVQGLLHEGFAEIVVVNDGSAEQYLTYFDEAAQLPGVTVLTHKVNQGKGRAMKTAFAWILEHRPEASGVVTVDGDGQHLPEDIRACVQAMEQQKDCVVLGARDFSGPDVPPRSRFGNNLTRGVFRVVCGIKIRDTQTGLRAIPLKYLPQMLEIEGERYEYETNQLLEMKKRDIPFSEVTIHTVYLDDNSSSHFHPIRDSLKIYRIIFRQALRFLASSLASFGIDIVLFTLLNLLTAKILPDGKIRLLIATAGARVVSSLFNYTVNRRVVFRSGAAVGSSMTRYYLLCVCQAALSYGLVALTSGLLRLNGSLLESVVKLVVDTVLFCASYRIQQQWVFKQ